MKQNQEEEQKKIAVKIDSDLYEELRKTVRESGFSSVDDYVNYVLRAQIGKKSEELSQADSEVVTSRLKALGYI